MSKYTEQSKKYSIKYRSTNYDTILLKIKKDAEISRDEIKSMADLAGESVNSYVLEAIKRRIEEEQWLFDIIKR